MVDTNQMVKVTLGATNIEYYKSKGYNFDQYKNENGRIPRGTIVDIKYTDLQKRSTAYIKYMCDYCGKETSVQYNGYSFNHEKSFIDKDACWDCREIKLQEINLIRNGNKSTRKQPTIEQIKSEFENRGYTLISNLYKNSQQNLVYECKEHKECGLQDITYNHFQQGHGCNYCGIESRVDKQKFTHNFVKSEFEKRGYILLSENYCRSTDYLNYICPLHKNKIQKITYNSFQTGSGCRFCSYEARAGENHSNWKGGITPLSKSLRNYLNPWKFDSLKSGNFQCAVTGDKKNLVVHHLYPFSLIVEETLSQLNIDLRDNISAYTQDELSLLTAKCLELHYQKGLGKPIQNKLHDLLHSIFGKVIIDNGEFEEFCTRYKAGEFDAQLAL